MHSRDWFQYNIEEPSSDIFYALYPPARIAFRVYGHLPAPRKSNRLNYRKKLITPYTIKLRKIPFSFISHN